MALQAFDAAPACLLRAGNDVPTSALVGARVVDRLGVGRTVVAGTFVAGFAVAIVADARDAVSGPFPARYLSMTPSRS
jgi:hypothetical protein